MTLPWTVGTLLAPGTDGRNKLLGGFNNNAVGSHFVNSVHRCCLRLDTGEFLQNTSASTLGFTNAWTIQCWIRPASLATSDCLIDIGTGQNTSEIVITKVNATLQVQLSNSAGTVFKDYTWTNGTAGFFTQIQTWQQVTVTWDGSTLKAYLNGVDQGVADTLTTDNSDSQTNASRDITAGANQAGGNSMTGEYHSILIWDTALSENAIRETYNHGNGSYFNPEVNSNDYTSSGDIVHWWRFGHDVSDIGKDWISTNAVDIDTNATGVTVADLRRHSPDGAYLDFNGTAEIVRKGVGGAGGPTGGVTVGIADSWTISIWCAPNSTAAGTIFEMNAGDTSTGSPEDSKIALNVSASKFQAIITDNTTTTTKTLTASYNVRGVTNEAQGSWYNVVLAKNGTSEFSMWIDGVEDQTSTTGIPTQTDATRVIGIGGDPRDNTNNWAGLVHSVLIWDTVLSDAAITTMYNKGFASLDPRRTNGDYAASANLVHWFRCGRPVGSVGSGTTYITDEVSGTGAIDLSADANGITDADWFIARDTCKGGSMLFDGTADFLSQTTDLNLSIVDTFTGAAWVRMNSSAGNARWFDTLETLGSNASRINMRLRGDLAGDPFVVTLRDDGGTNLKEYRWNGAAASTEWRHYTFTWDGVAEALRGWRDALEDTAPTKSSDAAITLTDRSRDIYLGRNSSASSDFYHGDIAYVAMWSTELTDNEITEIAMRGLEFDLREAGQVYASGASLQLWYLLGLDPNTLLGDNLGAVGSGADLTASSLDRTNASNLSPASIQVN